MVNFGYPYNDIVICKDSTDYLCKDSNDCLQMFYVFQVSSSNASTHILN